MHIYLRLARDAVSYYLEYGKTPQIFDYCYQGNSLLSQRLIPDLGIKAASFVTIIIDNELRGCIGSTIPADGNFCEDLISHAIAAAFDDNRFSPITKYELEQAKFEISILKDFEAMSDLYDFDLITHGVNIIYESKHGVYLPEVGKMFENKDKFLLSLAEKAGMNRNELLNSRATRFKTEKYMED